jgi:hypothetical protein
MPEKIPLLFHHVNRPADGPISSLIRHHFHVQGYGPHRFKQR